MEKHMSGIDAGGIGTALWGAMTKTLTVKGVAGVIGAGMLYMVGPAGPKVADGTVIVNAKAYEWAKRKEMAIRFAFAFMASETMGDWAVDVINGALPFLQAAKHPYVFVGAVGALGWYFGRWVALWLHDHQDTGIEKAIKDAKELLP